MKKIIFGFVLIFLVSIVNASEFGLDNNTVALWHFNEGSGNTIFDETSNNNDGTINGATWTSEGKFSNALGFDGIDDLVTVPYSQSIGELPELTLEAWIKRNSQSDGMIISKNGPYFLSVRNNVLEGGVYAGSGWTHITGKTELEVGVWYYIALTYDGNSIRIYLDGLEDKVEPKTGNILITGQSLHLGWGEPGHNQFFNGTVDEVRISNLSRVISSEPTEPNLEERIEMLEQRVEDLENRTSFLEILVDKIVEFIENLPKGLSKRWSN